MKFLDTLLCYLIKCALGILSFKKYLHFTFTLIVNSDNILGLKIKLTYFGIFRTNQVTKKNKVESFRWLTLYL